MPSNPVRGTESNVVANQATHLLNRFISENPIVAKIQYGMKITFIFILILFIDSVNRVYRVQIELAQATEASSGK